MNMNYRLCQAAAVYPTSSAFNPAPDFRSSPVSSPLLPSPVHLSLGAYGRCP
jgi:hypothetical protein